MTRRILDRIARAGPLDFAAFMEAALYDPADGYYADPGRAIGRHGDYFTSVSVGPAFGTILARWLLDRWHALGAPRRWRVAEPGAHDGQFAADLTAALAALDSAATAGLVYTVPEPLAARREALARRFATLPVAGLEILGPDAPPPPPLPGAVVANEVLDALPCHLIEFDGTRWLERAVDAAADGRLVLRPRPPADPALAAAVAPLGTSVPAGCRAEVRTGLGAFLRPLRDLLERGCLLFLDYGFARPELHHPDRREGTLRTFAGHRAGDDPLATPGACDLTAHVDFTAVADAAATLGLTPARFEPQGLFLTRLARPWLAALSNIPEPERAAAIRQFHTLTHPAHLGAAFHALELAWNVPADPAAAATARRRLALQPDPAAPAGPDPLRDLPVPA